MAASRDALEVGAKRSRSSWSSMDCLAWSVSPPVMARGLANNVVCLTGGARLLAPERGGAEEVRVNEVVVVVLDARSGMIGAVLKACPSLPGALPALEAAATLDDDEPAGLHAPLGRTGRKPEDLKRLGL